MLMLEFLIRWMSFWILVMNNLVILSETKNLLPITKILHCVQDDVLMGYKHL